MLNFSVVQIHLVHFSVQVTTLWWSDSSRGLIGACGICIGFVDIVLIVNSIRLFHFLFRQHLSFLLIFLSNPLVKLCFREVSELGIIDYWHFHQMFSH